MGALAVHKKEINRLRLLLHKGFLRSAWMRGVGLQLPGTVGASNPHAVHRLVAMNDAPDSGRLKTSIDFTVIGDRAFERYIYKARDVEKKTGTVTTDRGKGINIFGRGRDEKWRVAIDGWSSDMPAAK